MSEESSEGQQSSEASNITTSSGSPFSSVNMANSQIPPPDILELNDGSLASKWRIWVAAWKNYTLSTKLDKEEKARQVATLLVVIGKEANKVFRVFTFSSLDDAKKIEPVLRKFEEYCIHRGNTIYERFLFFTRDQSESETIGQYLTEIRQIAANCDFQSITPDQLLRDRLVPSTGNAKVRENLLKEKKLTLEKAVNIARAQMKIMSSECGLFAVKEQEIGQSEGVPIVTDGRIKDCRFVVEVMRDATALHLDRFVHIIRRKITLKPSVQLKVRCQLSKSVFI